MELIARF